MVTSIAKGGHRSYLITWQVQYAAGVDAGFEAGGTISRAAVAVLSFPSLQLQKSALMRRPTTFPYVPGFLSLRKIPAVL